MRLAVLVLASSTACTGDLPDPASRPSGRARFSVTSYNIIPLRPPYHPGRSVRTIIWGKNTGTAPGVPECFLAYAQTAPVAAETPVRPVEPGNHFEVQGTATFAEPLPQRAESEDAWCRAARSGTRPD
ncbi:MAG: hypothetical protein M3134_09920 [Actinomycetota bacterium]|nr:hypothetical protein [Actinomycetota bacterium]